MIGPAQVSKELNANDRMETPTPHPPQPVSASSNLTTVFVSLVVGALAGGLVSASIVNTKVTNTSNAVSQRSVTVQQDSATVDVVQQASPAVVSVVISKDYSKIYGNQQPSSPFDNFFGWPFAQQQAPQGKQEIGGGSGFVVSADGLIVTNRHVVSDTQADYSVVMNDGKKYDAKVVAIDPSDDVAIIKIEASGLPTLTLADSDSVQIGQAVVAIGNALGEYRNTVTSGIISGKSRTITAGDSSGGSETLENVFQTDAAINPGNSGGPLLDLTGHVIAINTAVNSQGQLIGFAIPANVVQRDLDNVNKTGKISRAFLGVRYVVVTKALADQEQLSVDHGALIKAANTTEPAVVAGSPAEKAGLVADDIITAVNGTEISTDRSLAGLLNQFNPGDTVTFKVYHQGTAKDVSVILEERK